jgi:hypothetical protein
MVADVADFVVTHMEDRGDPSDAVRREEERDLIIQRVAQHISRYAGRSKLIEFPWIERHSNALKQVDFTSEKDFILKMPQSDRERARVHKAQ